VALSAVRFRSINWRRTRFAVSPGGKHMRKSNKAKKLRERDFESLRGGSLPEGVAQRQFAAIRRKLAAEARAKAATRQQAAKLLGQAQPRIRSRGDTKVTQAMSGLLAISERLARQKLATPRRVIVPPGFWGSYTLRFTPPYTALGSVSVGDTNVQSGSPMISASGVDALGQMSCSVATNYNKPSSGTASNLMGVYFRPMFGSATATISFDSQLAFSWYVNSIQNSEAISEGQGLIQLYQYDGTLDEASLRRGTYLGWSEDAVNGLDFDVISEAGPTWSLEAPVSSSHFYFIVIRLSCEASGSGWPGSLAGASAMVTVPSITVTVTANIVAEP
jgi:hypothetical protein